MGSSSYRLQKIIIPIFRNKIRNITYFFKTSLLSETNILFKGFNNDKVNNIKLFTIEQSYQNIIHFLNRNVILEINDKFSGIILMFEVASRVSQFIKL